MTLLEVDLSVCLITTGIDEYLMPGVQPYILTSDRTRLTRLLLSIKFKWLFFLFLNDCIITKATLCLAILALQKSANLVQLCLISLKHLCVSISYFVNLHLIADMRFNYLKLTPSKIPTCASSLPSACYLLQDALVHWNAQDPPTDLNYIKASTCVLCFIISLKFLSPHILT